MKRKILWVAGLLVVASWALRNPVLAGGGRDDARYRTAAVTRGDIQAVVSSTAVINPLELVEVGSEVSGQIVMVNVDFNSRVRKGEVLAELDRVPFEDAVREDEASLQMAAAASDKAKVGLDGAKKKYDRTLDLYQRKLVSQEDKETDEEAYLKAKDDLEMAEAARTEAAAELEQSRFALKKTRILAPIDGIVITRNVNAGQTVSARYEAPVLFTVADNLATMRLQCDVDEADVGRVREGQKVEFTVEAFPADVFTGRVLQVQDDAETDSDVVRYPTVCEVDNPQNKLRPGMTATVTIHTGEAHDVLRVPSAALKFVPPVLTAAMSEFVRNASQSLAAGERPTVVWTLDKKMDPTPVLIKTGLAGPDFTEVVGGSLREGQTVVIGVLAK